MEYLYSPGPLGTFNPTPLSIPGGEIQLGPIIARTLDSIANAWRPAAINVADSYNNSLVAMLGNTGASDVGTVILQGFSGPWVETAKIISFFLCIILGVLFFSIWLRTYALNKPDRPITEQIAPPQPASGGPMSARWEEIQRHLESVREAEWKFAIIEADKLVDDALKRAGFQGDSFADRLERIPPGQIQHVDALWDAHRLRNRVAHEVNYFLRYTEAKHAIQAYGSVLRELGSI